MQGRKKRPPYISPGSIEEGVLTRLYGGSLTAASRRGIEGGAKRISRRRRETQKFSYVLWRKFWSGENPEVSPTTETVNGMVGVTLDKRRGLAFARPHSHTSDGYIYLYTSAVLLPLENGSSNSFERARKTRRGSERESS